MASPVGGTAGPKEQGVLRLLARGLSNAEIAHELVLSVATVKSDVAAILLELGVRDPPQAVIVAYGTGFVRPCSGPRPASNETT